MNRSYAVLGIILLLAVVSRWLPHPPNFTPMLALALFGGAYLASRWTAAGVIVLAMLISDALLGWHPLWWVVYLSLAAGVVLGHWTQRRGGRVAFAALGGSLLFFLVTNLAHWAMFQDYPPTPDGLLACYVAALPFFQYSLAGDLFYSAILFWRHGAGGSAVFQRFPRSCKNLRKRGNALDRFNPIFP
jgi:hypothetical protein